MSAARFAIPDEPHAPSEAYREVAAALPERYFSDPPPSHGMRIMLIGVDGVRTIWDFTEEDFLAVRRHTFAGRLSARILRRGQLGPISESDFIR